LLRRIVQRFYGPLNVLGGDLRIVRGRHGLCDSDPSIFRQQFAAVAPLCGGRRNEVCPASANSTPTEQRLVSDHLPAR
jgi:hypothetical protein